MKASIVFLALVQAVSLTIAHPTFRGLVVGNRRHLLESYDYVVVGAGASGLTVANRLSEDAGEQAQSPDDRQQESNSPLATTVLIIEAGQL
jgi:hypothetical protein